MFDLQLTSIVMRTAHRMTLFRRFACRYELRNVLPPRVGQLISFTISGFDIELYAPHATDLAADMNPTAAEAMPMIPRLFRSNSPVASDGQGDALLPTPPASEKRREFFAGKNPPLVLLW